ncbi:MAG TPA: hypothetical protein VFV50_03320 [Bdellovibrionales bacterium]|nr:hypothetical protein [Bdellovibrionales bacterium]
MNWLKKSVAVSLAFSLLLAQPLSAQSRRAAPPAASEAAEYNPGPNPETKMGKEVIDLFAEQPEYMLMADALMEEQKFRYIFGLMMTRIYSYDPNSVKIFVVGQDATHIAEAAKMPGTSGFGARVQSIGNYFGVDQGLATSNAFLSTIYGQYGAFDHFFVELDKNGKPQLRQSAFVSNSLWELANGEHSQIRSQRERFWEWMIKNNPQSLDLLLFFGGAARDSFGEFLRSRGFIVETKFDPERLKNVQVPATRNVGAGGNNTFAVPLTKDGKDVYEILMKDQLEPRHLRNGRPDYSKEEVRTMAVEALKAAGPRAIELMAFTGGGLFGSGVLTAAQLGGYDLSRVYRNERDRKAGRATNSLRGLVLSDGFIVDREIAFAVSPHPSSLSRMTDQAASLALKKAFAVLQKLKDETGWRVRPDRDSSGKLRVNRWDKGLDYEYGRADIRAGYFPFGAPADARVSRADAVRLDAQTILVGTREKRTPIDREELARVKQATPADAKDPNDLWSVRPRGEESRYVFDRGPGPEIAELLVNSIDQEALFRPKRGMKKVVKGRDVTFETHGIDAYNTKSWPGSGLFGFHRGQFDGSRALILADPHGIDELNTWRAMTGSRGQYLHGLMRDLGYGEEYLVLRTAPVTMDGATAEEWEYVRKHTEAYREAAIKRALQGGTIETIFTDGEVAKAEMERILKKLRLRDITVINIERDPADPSSGIREAGQAAKAEGIGRARARITGEKADIPASHLIYLSRISEGTGEGTVVKALGKALGAVRAIVTPDWVAEQVVIPRAETLASIEKIKRKFAELRLRVESQSLPEFFKSIRSDGSFETAQERRSERRRGRVVELSEARLQRFGAVPSRAGAAGSCRSAVSGF